jgi:mono/diheme cytochrome c family protein
MSSRIAGLVAAASVLLVATLGCSSSGTGTTAPSSATTAPLTTAPPTTAAARRPGETLGAFVFRTRCAACHGTRGEGNLGPPLVDIAEKMTEADQVSLVRSGRGRMPPFAPALTDADIAAVVAYTRTGLKQSQP